MNTSAIQARKIVGTGTEPRAEYDFYPTPKNVTIALLNIVHNIPKDIWECACGRGDISRVLEEFEFNVVSTDLIDYGYGLGGVDFLLTNKLLAPSIITNPPFTLAVEFAKHAMELGADRLFLLCKLAFLESKERKEFFSVYPPKWVHVFSRRILLTKNGEPPKGGGMIAFAWFEWEKGYHGHPSIDWI